MKLFRQTQRMFSRRRWLLLLIIAPFFMPVQTVKPSYRAVSRIKLNPPGYTQTHMERMNWLTRQAGILNSGKLLMAALRRAGLPAEEIGEQLLFIKDNLDITIERDDTLNIELIATEKYRLKAIAGEIIAVYFDMASKERAAARAEIYESRQQQFKSLDSGLKNAKAASDTARSALEDFQVSKMADDTPQIKTQIDELETRLSELKITYTEEHPQIKEIVRQLDKKLEALNDKQIQLEQERARNAALKGDYLKKKEALDKLSEEYNSLKSTPVSSGMQDVGNIISGPKVIDVGILETKFLDMAGKLLFGMAMALFCGLITEKFDKTVWSEDEIRHDLGIRTLGAVVKHKRKSASGLLIDCSKDSKIVKSFEAFRSNIQFINLATPLKSILYCSLLKKKGDLLAGNLAISMTFIGGRVGLVNISGQTKKYDRLLTSADSGSFKNMSGPIVFNNTPINNLKILNIKTPDTLEKQQAKEFVSSFKEKFDVIVIDSAPVTESVAGAALASVTDGVILGAERKRTGREFLLRNYKILSEVNARVLGAVLQR